MNYSYSVNPTDPLTVINFVISSLPILQPIIIGEGTHTYQITSVRTRTTTTLNLLTTTTKMEIFKVWRSDVGRVMVKNSLQNSYDRVIFLVYEEHYLTLVRWIDSYLRGH
jgi:hypothetical protein